MRVGSLQTIMFNISAQQMTGAKMLYLELRSLRSVNAVLCFSERLIIISGFITACCLIVTPTDRRNGSCLKVAHAIQSL